MDTHPGLDADQFAKLGPIEKLACFAWLDAAGFDPRTRALRLVLVMVGGENRVVTVREIDPLDGPRDVILVGKQPFPIVDTLTRSTGG